MTSRTVTVVNKLGLHARPAALLVTTAAKFESEVYFSKGELRINGKSIRGVMMLAAEKGSNLLIEANGPDEEAVLSALVEVVESGFGEEI